MNKFLNIVSFDVPYPPKYGGIIDVLYKIKELHNLGIEIHLHTFYKGEFQQNELLKFCKKVYFYKRNLSVLQVFSPLPYIVKTRDSKKLINHLLANNYPILFEGLHTTFPLLNTDFKTRKIIVRTHNIEHRYYNGLFKSETNIFKKLFFKLEAHKLKKYELILRNANFILSISPIEQDYFLSFHHEKSIYVPAFHGNSNINLKLGKGNYAIYNGDLRVADNLKACEFLITIFSKIEFPLIISSSFDNRKLLSKIKRYKNIEFIKVHEKKEIEDLLSNAHINLLPTFQNTGIKLKLINALFNSRFCIVNNNMIKNTGLENLCLIANSKIEFTKKINEIINCDFTEDLISDRIKTLSKFNNTANAKKILELI